MHKKKKKRNGDVAKILVIWMCYLPKFNNRYVCVLIFYYCIIPLPPTSDGRRQWVVWLSEPDAMPFAITINDDHRRVATVKLFYRVMHNFCYFSPVLWHCRRHVIYRRILYIIMQHYATLCNIICQLNYGQL